ncbi:MAG: SDR family oxidoreductase [Candidatus Omnitrophota bacterium]
MSKKLFRKNILITGGSSELGAHFVSRALREGARVFFTYHRNEKVARKLSRSGAFGFRLDLASSAEIGALVRTLSKKTSRLDVLIHNAAIAQEASLLHLSEAAWDRQMAVNLKAPYLLTQQLLPLFAENKGGGKILMVTSRVAVCGTAGLSAYAASKAGVIGLVRTLALELGPSGIRVNAVSPGFMLSSMTRSAGEDVLERNRQRSVLGQFSDPAEVADFLVHLCSDRMSGVSGQVLHYESRPIPG